MPDSCYSENVRNLKRFFWLLTILNKIDSLSWVGGGISLINSLINFLAACMFTQAVIWIYMFVKKNYIRFWL